ncbi:hypothetical protein RGQ29_012179 [Quercus rubra]|uniref:Uncharacterized protein n=1 Tax=Quercus rubra TaxID=3512 RepID=A0AAN7G0H3_QUERU|nr:hypothetical protein RGQ29_012179 [Quercus rubra]
MRWYGVSHGVQRMGRLGLAANLEFQQPIPKKSPGVPHLGLVCETPEIFQELAFSTKRFPVCFNKGKCTFNNESTVELSFSCISSKELVRFQNRLHKSLEKLMYQRGRSMTQGFDMESWTPSCPIARGVENEDITKAWNLICSYLDLPIIADAVGFKEVMFIPENQCYEELSFYQFAGHDDSTNCSNCTIV